MPRTSMIGSGSRCSSVMLGALPSTAAAFPENNTGATPSGAWRPCYEERLTSAAHVGLVVDRERAHHDPEPVVAGRVLLDDVIAHPAGRKRLALFALQGARREEVR